MKKAVLREYLKNRENKVTDINIGDQEEKKEVKPKKKAKKGE